MKKYPRLFIENDLDEQQVVNLNKNDSHYIAVVMRLKQEQYIEVFNGRGGLWLAKINDISKKSTQIFIEKQLISQQKPSYFLQLNFAPLKKSAMDILIQKSVEMGVTALQPMITEYTNIETIKIERLKAQIKEACEQCERLDIPTINEPVTFKKCCQNFTSKDAVFYGDETRQGIAAAAAFKQKQAYSQFQLLIGPEGGFSPSEFAFLRAKDYITAINLGPRILRAETAAIAAIAAFQITLGDWDYAFKENAS